jgi:hypothetical protein
MHRVELKDGYSGLLEAAKRLLFLMHRVELKVVCKWKL